MWKLMAQALGWSEAWDEDGPEPLLVVWHDRSGRHYTGPNAWKYAVRHAFSRHRLVYVKPEHRQ